MCEIAVYNPEELSTNDAFDLSFDMYQSNSDGMGALAVYKNDDHFEYEPFAQADPSWAEFMEFLMDKEDAWRIILHARLSTTGADNDTNTHPLEVGEGADFDWVIHNGVVTNHDTIRQNAEENGHTYATEVDSESIAHAVETFPESIDDIDTKYEYRLAGRLNYILCNEDGIFVHNTGKYEWTEDFTMTRCYRRLSFEDATDRIKWMILKPDDTVETVEKDRIQASTTSATRRGSYWAGAGGNGTTQSRFRSQESEGQSGGSTSEAKPESVSDLPDDLGALFNDQGELIAWWEEDDNEKYTTSYDEYKDQYGKGNEDEVIVYGDELGASHEPDERVPENATGMYISDDGSRIDWWEMGEVDDDVNHGSVTVDEVVLEATIEEHETLFDLPDSEGDSGNGSTKKCSRSSAKQAESSSKKSGNGYATVNGVTYSESDLEMWDGHYGPEPNPAD